MSQSHEQWQLTAGAAERYERYRVPRMHLPVAQRLLERVAPRPGQRVLDVACGTGIVARLAVSHVAPSGKVVGLDVNGEMLAVARASAAGLAIEWRQGDACKLPFGEAEFDVVFCQQGLQFFPDRARALSEMRRVTAPGGAVALSVNVASEYNLALSEALARHAGAAAATHSLAAFALGDMAQLAALVDGAGFALAEIQTLALTRRVEPSQEWLLQETDSTPYGAEIARLAAPTRAEMLREIAARLAQFWTGDCFSVPREVHVVYARK